MSNDNGPTYLDDFFGPASINGLLKRGRVQIAGAVVTDDPVSKTTLVTITAQSFTLSATSSDLAQGDCFCVDATSSTTGRVTKAVPVALAAAGAVLGVALGPVVAGSPFSGSVGTIPNSITSLGPSAGYRAVGVTTLAKLIILGANLEDVIVVGVADTVGNVTLQPRSPALSSGRRVFTAQLFRAVGDGTTDDTAAIQAAHEFLALYRSATVHLPYTPNGYRIKNLHLTRGGGCLQGDGCGGSDLYYATKLVFDVGSDGIHIDGQGEASNAAGAQNFTLKDLLVVPSGSPLSHTNASADFVAFGREWTANTVVHVGTVVVPPLAFADGYHYVCSIAGTTGGSAPTWGTSTVVSGSATFVRRLISQDVPVWQANHAYALGAIVRPTFTGDHAISANGYSAIYKRVVGSGGGTSGGSEPTWGTSASVTDSGVTWKRIDNIFLIHLNGGTDTDWLVGQGVRLEGGGRRGNIEGDLLKGTVVVGSADVTFPGLTTPPFRAGEYVAADTLGSAFWPTPTKVLSTSSNVMTLETVAASDTVLTNVPFGYQLDYHGEIAEIVPTTPANTTFIMVEYLGGAIANATLRHSDRAIVVRNKARLDNVSTSANDGVQGHGTGIGVYVHGDHSDYRYSNANGTEVIGGNHFFSHHGMWVSGNDANACAFSNIDFYSENWSFTDDSSLGNALVASQVAGGFGYRVADDNTNISTWVGCYTEGGTISIAARNTTIVGGVMPIDSGGNAWVQGVFNLINIGNIDRFGRYELNANPKQFLMQWRHASNPTHVMRVVKSLVSESGPIDGWWAWKQDDLYTQVPMMISDTDADVGGGNIWFPNGFHLGRSGSNLPTAPARRRFFSGDAVPASGAHALGDVMLFRWPIPTSAIGLACVEAGTPGVFLPFGQARSPYPLSKSVAGSSSPITLTALEASAEAIELTGARTAALILQCDTPAILNADTGNGYTGIDDTYWIKPFTNSATGNYPITVRGSTGDTGVTLAPGATCTLINKAGVVSRAGLEVAQSTTADVVAAQTIDWKGGLDADGTALPDAHSKRSAQTTTGTVTSVVLASYPIATGETRVITVLFVADHVSGGAGSPASFYDQRRMTVRNDAGTVNVVKADASLDSSALAGFSSALAINGINVEAQASQSAASKVVHWGVTAEGIGQS